MPIEHWSFLSSQTDWFNPSGTTEQMEWRFVNLSFLSLKHSGLRTVVFVFDHRTDRLMTLQLYSVHYIFQNLPSESNKAADFKLLLQYGMQKAPLAQKLIFQAGCLLIYVVFVSVGVLPLIEQLVWWCDQIASTAWLPFNYWSRFGGTLRSLQ